MTKAKALSKVTRKRGRPPKVTLSPLLPVPDGHAEISKEEGGSVFVGSEEAMAEEPNARDLGFNPNPKQGGNEIEVEETAMPENAKLWVDVISGSCKTENGKALKFVAPIIVNGEAVVEIEEEDVAGERRFWETSLIMYAIGGDLSMTAVKNFMAKEWNFVKLPEMFYNDEGYFILKFKTKKEREEVMLQGPYHT
ncbi:unnamed protein product [Vicia faba]|uniref:DUF4283 domain-containing protein n=1 Tax=Vicia faba TaxID=3906 RepID=A0AAV0ZTD7_VICFA|nr:unnamed protein product [Vicia faba]